MKKIVLLFISLFLFIPGIVEAASITSSLDCGSSFVRGENVTCNIKVTSSVLIDGASGRFDFDSSKITFVNFEAKSGFSVLLANKSGFALSNLAGKSGSFVIGSVTLKINAAAKFDISEFEVASGDYMYSVSFAAMNFKLKSSNANLGSLSLSNGTLSPSFSANTTSYTATVNDSSVKINATKGESVQTISGTGTKKLSYGKNTFKVVVTSEAGNKKTYTIVITRPDSRSTNNYLKNLAISNSNISFKKETTKYTVNVDSNVTSLKVDATLEDSKASFVSGFGPRTVNLNYGDNSIVVKVKAENESVRTYTLNVNRKDNRSSNNYLKELKLSSGALTFVKDTLDYNVSVPFETVRLEITAVPEDEKSNVVVNNVDLAIGNNVITILVTSENEDVKIYKINVNRLTETAQMSDNNNVSKIEIVGHDFEFVKDVFEYDLTLKNEDELHFFIELEDDRANYVIDGNKDLKDGSVVNVITTSESGQKKEYKFNITMLEEEKEESCNKCLICGIVGFGLGVLITLLVLVILRKFKKKKDVNDTVVNEVVTQKEETNEVITQDEENVVSAETNEVSGDVEMPKGNVEVEQSFYDNKY